MTPDGSTMVGIMQSALQQPGDPAGAKDPASRIVTIDLHTYKTKQYIYLLDLPRLPGIASSEITAISNTQFLVDERDGNFEPFAAKTLYEVDINGATDISGLTVGGHTPEAFAGAAEPERGARRAHCGRGQRGPEATVCPGRRAVERARPDRQPFGHDKVEGVATTDSGKTLYLSNDDDFSIDTIAVRRRRSLDGPPEDAAGHRRRTAARFSRSTPPSCRRS